MATMLEILSDEVIIQFFEYLDAYRLFKAFFNLNSRFNWLLKDQFLYLKFNSKYVRSVNAVDAKMWYTMMNHLTAVTLINDKYIRIFMSVFTPTSFMCLQSLALHRVCINKENGSIARYISNLKSLKNLRVQAIGGIDALTIMVFHFNELPELKSFECVSPGYSTNVMFSTPQKTNIESLTVASILFGLGSILEKTPKIKYLNIDLTNNKPKMPVLRISPLPMVMNLTHLKMKIHSISYNDLLDIMKSMPHLEKLELSGFSLGQNLDNGHQLKQLFGHLQQVELDNLECRTTATSKDTILTTFKDDIDSFWLDVTCFIKYERAYISAFGCAR